MRLSHWRSLVAFGMYRIHRSFAVFPMLIPISFHVPLAMVHPWVGWARVVNPSCVMTVEPCMFSSHRRDFVGFGPSPVRCPMLVEIPLTNLLGE